jgi:hypothetical protein
MDCQRRHSSCQSLETNTRAFARRFVRYAQEDVHAQDGRTPRPRPASIGLRLRYALVVQSRYAKRHGNNGRTCKNMIRRDCNLSEGDIQCPEKIPNGDDGFLHCRFVIGHSGKHKTCYDNGEEWENFGVGDSLSMDTGHGDKIPRS